MHWIDLSIMGLYVIGMFVIGLLAKGEENTAGYFTAGGRMSGWFSTIVVGISIAGTLFSGISFIAMPSVAYSDGIILVCGSVLFGMPACYLILRCWFLPRYLGGGWRFPYEILEHRFGAPTRTVAASLFILMRIGWMAAMIYAPTVAIMTMGNLDERWFWPIVLVTGLSNTIYTVFSGVRGVIVTECVQMIVIATGVTATIIFALTNLPVSWPTAANHLLASGRLSLDKFSLDPKAGLTIFTVMIGFTVGNLTNYMADQMSLQRYLATGSVKAAGRSFAVNLIGVIVVSLLLSAVGLSLFVYYSYVHDPGLPAGPDQVFPYFVKTRLPVGIAGLLLAALLAATSIPSGINTLAGVLTLDFHARLKPNMCDRQQLFWAKAYSLLLGLGATFAAGMVSKLGTLFQLTQIILGVFAGPLLSVMVVAVAGWRWPGWAMLTGVLVGWFAGVGVVFAGAAPLWVAPASAAMTIAAAGVLTQVGQRRSGSHKIRPICTPVVEQ